MSVTGVWILLFAMIGDVLGIIVLAWLLADVVNPSGAPTIQDLTYILIPVGAVGALIAYFDRRIARQIAPIMRTVRRLERQMEKLTGTYIPDDTDEIIPHR